MMIRRRMRLQYVIMAGLKRTPKPMKYFSMGTKWKTKDLTRIPMEGRLYHIKYDTLINKEG
jgi:hypothetical protein